MPTIAWPTSRLLSVDIVRTIAAVKKFKNEEEFVSPDDQKALVRRYVDEVWNGRQSPLPFFAAHYQRYLAATAAPLNGPAQHQRIMRFHHAFPDLHMTIEDLLAEGDRVVFRATMRGTHRGMFRGIDPTGKQIAVTVLDVVRIEQGLFAAQWGGPDLLDLLRQLGAVDAVATEE